MANETEPLLHSSGIDQESTDLRECIEGAKTPTARLDLAFFLVAQLGTNSTTVHKISALMRKTLLGIFLALADDSFVLSTHGEIASHFSAMSVSHWLVTGYNLGYAVALPAVSGRSLFVSRLCQILIK